MLLGEFFFQNPRISAWVFCTIVAINAGLLLNLGLMAYGWSTFHFHDYGRKGRFPKNSTRNLQGGPRSNRYKWSDMGPFNMAENKLGTWGEITPLISCTTPCITGCRYFYRPLKFLLFFGSV